MSRSSAIAALALSPLVSGFVITPRITRASASPIPRVEPRMDVLLDSVVICGICLIAGEGFMQARPAQIGFDDLFLATPDAPRPFGLDDLYRMDGKSWEGPPIDEASFGTSAECAAREKVADEVFERATAHLEGQGMGIEEPRDRLDQSFADELDKAMAKNTKPKAKRPNKEISL
jgi:hypothetical protein